MKPFTRGKLTPEQYEDMQVASAMLKPESPVKGKEAERLYARLLEQAKEALAAGGQMMFDPPTSS